MMGLYNSAEASRGLQEKGAFQFSAMAPLVLAFTAALARLVIAQPRRQCVSQGLVRLLQWFDSCAGTLTSPGAAGMPRISLFLGALAVA